MVTLTVEKDWTGKYTFTVSNGFDSQSLTPGTYVSDFQIFKLTKLNKTSSMPEVLMMVLE